MAQPVLCLGVGQGSDYVEADCGEAAFHFLFPSVLSFPWAHLTHFPFPLGRAAPEYPTVSPECPTLGSKFRSLPFPLTWTLATSVDLRSGNLFFPPSLACAP